MTAGDATTIRPRDHGRHRTAAAAFLAAAAIGGCTPPTLHVRIVDGTSGSPLAGVQATHPTPPGTDAGTPAEASEANAGTTGFDGRLTLMPEHYRGSESAFLFTAAGYLPAGLAYEINDSIFQPEYVDVVSPASGTTIQNQAEPVAGIITIRLYRDGALSKTEPHPANVPEHTP